MWRKYKKAILISIFCQLIFIGSIFTVYYFFINVKNKSQIDTTNLPTFTEQELQKYNGNDSSKPIYLGLDGLVYDISAGREYYSQNQPYNFLAGKDSSDKLHIFGADLIKNKYPVIGKLEKNENP